MGSGKTGANGHQQPLLAAGPEKPRALSALSENSLGLPVTQASVKRTSSQTPGVGYPDVNSPMITSPFASRRVYKSEETTAQALRTQVTLSCCIMFAEGFYATQLFPYVSFMTEELRGTTVQLGVYTGLVYTAQSAGMLLSAFLWARASNTYGRRVCLLVGLLCATCSTFILAFSSNYWFTTCLRLMSGLLNNNLSIVRTALRERFQRENADDTSAFSLLSVAFGASSVAGPSLGGMMYGLLPDGLFGACRRWTAPMLVCSSLYAASLVFSYFWLPETADLKLTRASLPIGARTQVGEPGDQATAPLLRQPKFLLLLLMAGGHSYTFTGWELVYPLFARTGTELGGEAWDTRLIGVTFLMGSIGLMVWSLAVYPRLAKLVPLVRLWVGHWILPVVIMPIFARGLPRLLQSGFGPRSPMVLLWNFLAQVIISVLVGSQFISVQLLINGYVAILPNGARLLALANGYLVSTQALVRAASPLSSGFLFTFGMHAKETGSPFLSEAIAFDHLSFVALSCCICCAVLLTSMM